MSAHQPQPITTMADLLAHAIELELESAECYHLLANSMETHNNRQAALLFDQLAHSAEERAESLQLHAGSDPLPELAPWEHHCAPAGGVAQCMSQAHYQMTPGQVLNLAIRNERQALDCLLRMAAEIRVPEEYPAVKEIVTEKERQVELLTERLTRETLGHNVPPEDLIRRMYPNRDIDYRFQSQ